MYELSGATSLTGKRDVTENRTCRQVLDIIASTSGRLTVASATRTAGAG
jgi:hypothetical protein